MHTYTIRQGCSFVMPDGTLKQAGETIELPTDVAATHAGLLDAPPAAEPDQTQFADLGLN